MGRTRLRYPARALIRVSTSRLPQPGETTKLKSTYKAKPVISSITAMRGNDTRRRLRRPNVSMVQIAGPANTKLTAPKPKEARRAAVWLKPLCTKMFEE